MSKSLGNAMDPLDLSQKYGTDALRISLIIGTGPGNDSKISEDKIKAYKNFANKLWNITRFVMSSIPTGTFTKSELNESDMKIMDEFDNQIKDITNDMDNYRFYMASEKIYHYIWDSFASVIIEESKPIISSDDEKAKTSRQTLLVTILEKSLKVLHPFMPFVTEEIWSIMPIDNKKLLMVEKWPI
jgi:valyl-tRNA synthetase